MVLLYSGEQHGVDILYFAQNLELMFPQSSCHSLLGTQWDWKWSLRSHLNLNSKLLDLVPSFSFLLHCLSLIVEGNRKCLILPAAFGCSQHRDSNTKFAEQEQELMACDCTKAAGFVVCSWWVPGHRGQSWGPDLIVSDALHTRIHNQILLQMQKKLKHQQKNRRRDLPNWPEFNFSVPKGANRKQNRINSPYLLSSQLKSWRHFQTMKTSCLFLFVHISSIHIPTVVSLALLLIHWQRVSCTFACEEKFMHVCKISSV